MEKFPKWAQPWVKAGDQVTHGLNLALKLKRPALMPLLLWDIVVARPRIELAMQELSFLHYARFVPSWDGSALMVVTEFDGPLEPYVMDFVIAIGDVFDTLLGYVEDAPPLPVRDHPEEFWRFVRKWNRVPFGPRGAHDDATLFPPDFDYPIYSAYPDRTVIDVTGSRKALLPPALDRPAAYIDLHDVQGNILRGYRATAATHLFFTITDPAAARAWLSTTLPDDAALHGSPWGGVMSAAPWGRDAKGLVEKPKVMTNVGMTFAGLEKLLPGRADLKRFPVAFREGADKRKEINGDIGPSDPAQWRFGQQQQAIHVVVSVYTIAPAAAPGLAPAAMSLDAFHTARAALLKESTENGMSLVHTEQAETLPDSALYFGYRDGIAHPRISGQCQPAEPDFQPASSPGEFLLGAGYQSIFGGPSLGDMPGDLAANGTFGVLRLLEQHVEAFEQTLKKEAPRLAIDEELLKAKLLGRWSGGQPLALDPVAPSAGDPRNDFDYAPSWEHPQVENDHEGMLCPVGAHIRRSNPRTARVAGQRHSRRLLRRGMPIKWDDDGTERKGLLGLFIGASLERQFEFIQQQWIQGSIAASGIRGTQDPIAGIRSVPTAFSVPGHGTMEVPPLVTTRGCLYLFFPSLSMLRGLGHANAAPALHALEGRARAYPAQANMKQLEGAELLAELQNLQGLPDDIAQFLRELLSEKLPDSGFVETLVANFAPARPSFEPADPGSPGDIRPLDPLFIADPYPAYARLRNAGRSVVWVREHAAYWVLARNDAQRLFAEPDLFLQQPSDAKLRGIITMDEPRHHAVREHVDAALRSAGKNVDAFVQEAADAALARLKGLAQFDLMPAYGSDVPRAVFWRILGVAEDDQPACDALAQRMMRHYGQPARPGMSDRIVFADAAVRLTGRLGWMLAKARLGAPSFKGTFIGELAKRTLVPAGLDFQESLMTLVQMVLAGYMSSQFLLGTAVRNILTPDPRPARNGEMPWTRLAGLNASKDPAFGQALKLALEEARRVDPPVTIVERYAARDGVTIGGVTLRKDCPVYAVVGSANRDGPVAEAREQFHWDRAPGDGHLSLGYGIHECVGKWLQEKMVPAALTRLMEAMPGLKLCDRVAVPAWFDNIYFRALQSLPVQRCP